MNNSRVLSPEDLSKWLESHLKLLAYARTDFERWVRRQSKQGNKPEEDLIRNGLSILSDFNDDVERLKKEISRGLSATDTELETFLARCIDTTSHVAQISIIIRDERMDLLSGKRGGEKSGEVRRSKDPCKQKNKIRQLTEELLLKGVTGQAEIVAYIENALEFDEEFQNCLKRTGREMFSHKWIQELVKKQCVDERQAESWPVSH